MEKAEIVGAAIMGAIFPKSMTAKFVGKVIGRRIGAELERGRPLLAVGVDEEAAVIGELRAEERRSRVGGANGAGTPRRKPRRAKKASKQS